MVTEIRIYYEGDGLLQPGLRTFLSEIYDRAQNRFRVRLIAANGAPARDSGTAIRTHTAAWNILLLDSEGPDSGRLSVSLCEKHGWDLSHADSIFWMVEMMESWFHADMDALEDFYKRGFNRTKLRANPKVEKISKKDLSDGLKAATQNSNKGEYHKTAHGPKLLALIRPAAVRGAAPNCRRMFETILGRIDLKE